MPEVGCLMLYHPVASARRRIVVYLGPAWFRETAGWVMDPSLAWVLIEGRMTVVFTHQFLPPEEAPWVI